MNAATAYLEDYDTFRKEEREFWDRCFERAMSNELDCKSAAEHADFCLLQRQHRFNGSNFRSQGRP